MVSFTTSLAVAAIATAATTSSAFALKEGDYFRPSSDVTSGIYGTTAAYRRSPCPALNTLANHGYLPRNVNITHDMLATALQTSHTDAYYGNDPMTVNETLAEDLFNRAGADGLLTNKIVAATRKDRGNTCNAENPECKYGVKAQTLPFLEASVLLMALGSGDAISVDHARSFIIDEKIPEDYTAPESTVGVVALLARAATLKAESLA
ncbi:unnamed protein product [Phytophthora lilii]|uniref:Unnamed protein product n=1 Tax=Phytophthora lilii TaxID=2077276 RepID=A0A9W6TCF8_9STRA|nr:unnamed protein product [Phytophthora lilii]